MNLVISAIERQIKIEKAKVSKRNMMLSTQDQVLHSEPLPPNTESYLKQLEEALVILKNHN